MSNIQNLEFSVLGALVLEDENFYRVSEIVEPEMFLNADCMELAKAIWARIEAGKKLDIDLLAQDCSRWSYKSIFNLIDHANTFNLEELAERIRESFIVRQEITIHEQALKDLKGGKNYQEVLSDSEKTRNEVIPEENTEEKKVEIIQRVWDNVANAMNNKTGVTGIPTGYNDLDLLTGGWHENDMNIIAGRPKMGKTQLALNYALNVALQGVPVGYFSIEMNSEQIYQRLAGILANINQEKMRNGKLSKIEYERFEKAMERLYEIPIHVVANIGKLSKIKNKARTLARKPGIKFMVVDYLQLIDSELKTDNPNINVSHISRNLKILAGEKNLNVPLLVLSQLNRDVEKRGGWKRPILSDLRDSGAIEQDADQVLFVYRPAYYGFLEDEEGNSLKDITELIFAANRHGRLGTLMRDSRYPHMRIEEIKEEETVSVNDTDYVSLNGHSQNGSVPF